MPRQNNFHSSENLRENLLEQIAVKFLLNLPKSQRKQKNRLAYHYQKAYYYLMDEVLKQKPDEEFHKAQSFRVFFFQKINETIQKLKPTLNRNKNLYLQSTQIVKILNRQKPTCGAIILSQQQNKVLVIESGGKLGFPKGGKNETQASEDCAARQVKEEVGLFIHNYINPQDKVQFLSMGQMPATYFIVRDFDMRQPLKIDKNQIDDAYWINFSDLSKAVWKLTAKSRIAWKLFEETIQIKPKITMEEFLTIYKPKQKHLEEEQQYQQNPLLNFKFNRQRLMQTLRADF